MADEISREEKLAAGLKKLKQFQQRSSKSKNSRKKSPTMNDSPSSKISSQGTSRKLSADSSVEKVPLTDSSTVDFEQSKNKSSSISVLNEGASVQDLNNSVQNEKLSQKSKSDLQLNVPKELSSTESLRQISLQVNGLMSETDAFVNGDISQEESPNQENQSLEQRNQELASLVNNLRQFNDQLQFQLHELKAKNKRQHQTFEQEKQALLEKAHKEQVSLKDQLNVHIQTIGILVAEKTELQSSLSLSQQTSKQKTGEVEELLGRLRASRQRASDLERELNSVNSSYQQLEKLSKESSKEVERLKSEIYKYSKSNEDLNSANTELKEKLNRKIQDLQNLEKELSDYRNKLSAVESQSQLLPPEENSSQNRNQLEEIFQEKINLEKQISLLKASVDKLMNERDQMAEQYQQYVLQLSEKVTSLQDELKQLRNEKDELSKEKNRLQEQLEAQNSQNGSISKEDPAELKLQITVLKNHNDELTKKWQAEIATNSSLCEQIRNLEDRINDLEKLIARMKDDQVDQNRLVETMQSDKIAASRAVAQNRELKKQLEELQNGFVEMSNDKLELTERLDAEKHKTKELGERLSQQEEELHEIQDQLAQKEAELQNLHKSNTKGIFQQNQIADRMRHYEAQGQLAEMLQKELHQAQEQINSLTSLNSELRMALATQAEITVSDENQKEDKDSSKRNDLVASLSASVRQLEMERNQMMKQLEEQRANKLQLNEEMKKRETQFNKGDIENDDVVSKQEYVMMKNAMNQLEERFKQTMNRIAELTEERQQLEHLVLQLQGETDTIGDYIALYQIQRGLMRKRASEKDDYIAQLARDREDLKAKLGELQNLVLRLLEERKQFQSQSSTLNENFEDLDLPDLSRNKVQPLGDALNQPCERHFNGGIHDDSMDSVPPKPETTAEKIIELLSDIETTNLVEKPVLDSFHPCPVCSGRLITV